MQHRPDAVGFVQADLDEVIAAAQRPQLMRDALHLVLRHARHDREAVEAPHDRRAATLERRPFLDRVVESRHVLVRREADRNRALDRGADRRERVGQIGGGQRGAHRDHPAADVDADRGRNDRRARRDDRSHRGALAEVHVRHHRDRAGKDRQRREIADLRPGFVLDRNAGGPRAHVVAHDSILSNTFRHGPGGLPRRVPRLLTARGCARRRSSIVS